MYGGRIGGFSSVQNVDMKTQRQKARMFSELILAEDDEIKKTAFCKMSGLMRQKLAMDGDRLE